MKMKKLWIFSRLSNDMHAFMNVFVCGMTPVYSLPVPVSNTQFASIRTIAWWNGECGRWEIITMKMFYQKTSFLEFALQQKKNAFACEVCSTECEIIKINNNKIIAEYLVHAWNTKCHSFPFWVHCCIWCPKWIGMVDVVVHVMSVRTLKFSIIWTEWTVR